MVLPSGGNGSERSRKRPPSPAGHSFVRGHLNRCIVPAQRTQQTERPGLFPVVFDPPVTLPADGNPEGLMKQEHAPPALIMVTLGRRHAPLEQSQKYSTPAIFRQAKPLLDAPRINPLFLCPLRRPAGRRAESSVLTKRVERWVGGRRRPELGKLKPERLFHRVESAAISKSAFPRFASRTLRFHSCDLECGMTRDPTGIGARRKPAPAVSAACRPAVDSSTARAAAARS